MRGRPRQPDAPATIAWDGRETSGVIVSVGFASLMCMLDGHPQDHGARCLCPDSDPPSLPGHDCQCMRPP